MSDPVGGTPFLEKKIANLSGTPYFNDTFLPGTMKVDKSLFKDLYIKLNQVEDKLIYKKGENGALMEPIGKVTEFTINTPDGKVLLFRNFGVDKSDFYQVLVEGPVTLLKKTKKSQLETVGYNSAGTETTITSATSYSVPSNNGELKVIKRDKDIVKLFPEKGAELEKYIKAENLNFKSDADFIKVISYYNTLK